MFHGNFLSKAPTNSSSIIAYFNHGIQIFKKQKNLRAFPFSFKGYFFKPGNATAIATNIDIFSSLFFIKMRNKTTNNIRIDVQALWRAETIEK